MQFSFKKILSVDLNELLGLRRPMPLGEIASLCRELVFLIGTGVDLARAFIILSNIIHHKALGRVLERLLQGKSFSAALASDSAFPPLMADMCHVGEITGRLSSVMDLLAAYYENESQNRQSLRSVMLYPLFVSLMMVGVVVLTVTYVLPNYAQLFVSEGLILPLPTRILIALSDAVLEHPYAVLSAAVLIVLGIIIFFRSGAGRYCTGFMKISFPGLRFFGRKTMNLRFCRCMALVLGSGEHMQAAMETTQRTLDNPYLAGMIKSIRTELATGKMLWESLTPYACFDPMLVQMVRVGEESGQITETLQKCAEYFQKAADRNTALLNRMAEPVATLVLGAVMAFVALSILMPTYALTNAL